MFPVFGMQASKPRINRLAFERQHSKDAFMHAPLQFTADESIEGLDAQREFAIQRFRSGVMAWRLPTRMLPSTGGRPRT
jgi:hypothetical protein